MSEAASQATVYVVDDKADDSRALQALLGEQGLASTAFARADEFELALAARPAAPACLLLDLCAAGAAGPVLFRRLAALGAHEALPVIFLTAHGDLDTVAEMFRLGAFDFIRKPAPAQQLTQRVAEALAASAAHLEAQRSRVVFESLVDRLSDRQRDIVGLVVRGLPNKTIARVLAISVRTVEANRARIFRRLRVRSAIELAVQMSQFCPPETGHVGHETQRTAALQIL